MCVFTGLFTLYSNKTASGSHVSSAASNSSGKREEGVKFKVVVIKYILCQSNGKLSTV